MFLQSRRQDPAYMRCTLAVFFTLITLATPLAGQAPAGHIYWVGFYQALPGKAAAYNKALTDIVDPVLDELVRRKQLVSHVQLAQYAGAGENTNLVILEFPNWAALDTYDAKLDEAARAVLHKSFSEATAGFTELRRLMRLEIYRLASQQP
jgi:hypothetical protein